MVTCGIVDYGRWSHCVRMTNGSVELIVTTDVGPRVLRYGFVKGNNLFLEEESQMGLVGGEEWRCYGGHRMGHAPEEKDRSFIADNEPVEWQWDDDRAILTLTPPIEKPTGIGRQMLIRMDAKTSRVNVVHRFTNRNLWEIDFAPVGTTAMVRGGRVLLPQEPFVSAGTSPPPARSMVLWPFTDMSDLRWTWGTRYVQLQQDDGRPMPQKIGAYNTLGWLGYAVDGLFFVKQFACQHGVLYPDLGCNCEAFTDGRKVEISSLGPLTLVCPNQTVEHVETWMLGKEPISRMEDDIDHALLQLLKTHGTTDED